MNEAYVEDGVLIRRLASGERSALEGLYDRHCDRVYGLALTLCQDREVAEEAARSVFAEAWRQRARFAGRDEDFESWLIAATSRCCARLAAAEGDSGRTVKRRLREGLERLAGSLRRGSDLV